MNRKLIKNFLIFLTYLSIFLQNSVNHYGKKSVIQQLIRLPNWKYLVSRIRLRKPEESQKHAWKHSHTEYLTWASWNTFLFFLCSKGSLTCSLLLGIFYLIVKKRHLGDNLFHSIFTLCDQVLKFDWHSTFTSTVGSKDPNVFVERLKCCALLHPCAYWNILK